MAAATVSPCRRHSTIPATSLADLDGLALVMDCLTLGCATERSVLMRDLADVYGRRPTLAEALHRMRCAGCRGRAGAAWLVSGPAAVARARAARVALIGPDARE